MQVKRVKLSLWMLGGTVMICAVLWLLPVMTFNSLPAETPAKVTLAQVRLGEVEQVLAVTARLRYEAEYAAIAPAGGVVEQVYVSAGDRVRKDQALFKLSGQAQESMMAAALSAPDIEGAEELMRKTGAVLDELTVRAASDGVVHQVSVAQYSGVVQGTPGMILSAGNQQLIASVVMRDAADVREGMDCRVYLDDEMICRGTVKAVGALETDSMTGQSVSQVTIRPEKELELPLGAALEVEIILAAQEDVPVVPVAALDEEDHVWWVADGRCYRMEAGVVLMDELNAWISLPEGTVVVLTGDVVQGQRIREVNR